jgi:hypothetical protein
MSASLGTTSPQFKINPALFTPKFLLEVNLGSEKPRNAEIDKMQIAALNPF